MDFKRLGKRIREERQRQGLTQSVLAEAVDISDAFMGQIERGERCLSVDTLVRLINHLGVSADYLLSDSVSDSDGAVVNQFKQLIDGQTPEHKHMAIGLVQTMFAHLNKNG
jgi:transcriptional regulator with XRE-family HTH domain